jgi:hypothetical protein
VVLRREFSDHPISLQYNLGQNKFSKNFTKKFIWQLFLLPIILATLQRYFTFLMEDSQSFFLPLNMVHVVIYTIVITTRIPTLLFG